MSSLVHSPPFWGEKRHLRPSQEVGARLMVGASVGLGLGCGVVGGLTGSLLGEEVTGLDVVGLGVGLGVGPGVTLTVILASSQAPRSSQAS